MKGALRWAGMGLALIVALLVVGAGVVYATTGSRMNRSYEVHDWAAAIPTSPEAVEEGAHIATIRGCTDCHSPDMGGRVFIEDAALGKLYGSNLTRGEGGVGGQYDAAGWEAAIRHGVAHDGRPLIFMPSHEYHGISDADLASLVAFISTRPSVDRTLPRSTVGPLGRVLHFTGQMPLLPAELVDHGPHREMAPPRAATAEYGRYLSATCMGCHGEGFSGGKIPGVPPNWPVAANLTPDAETGLGSWTEEDFFQIMRSGTRPDGRVIEPEFMPWPSLGSMREEEIQALWLYFRSLPPTPHGSR